MDLSVKQKRIALFVGGCITTRLFLVFLAANASKPQLTLLGLLALIPALGFIYIYMTGSRKTGAEVFGDRIWWNNLRPFHGLMYLLFAFFAVNDQREYAWKTLLLDVTVGAAAFTNYHLNN